MSKCVLSGLIHNRYVRVSPRNITQAVLAFHNIVKLEYVHDDVDDRLKPSLLTPLCKSAIL